jgi:2-polyprenyl-3-methyl-5-hydroxy-6-metoxy-1,4-benzoquinol methylase
MDDDTQFTDYDDAAIVKYLEHFETSWNSLYERPAVIERLPELKDKNVLDAGCAAGYFTQYALNRGASVTAIDISQKMLDRLAQNSKTGNLKTYRADLSQPLAFLKDAEFDCIICSMTIHYLKDWGPTLAEFYRVLKPGGRLVISTLHPLATYLFFKPQSYFDTMLVSVPWAGKDTQPLNVRYYIRPLHEILYPVTKSGFKIVAIDEPLPNDDCKKRAPDTYAKLMKEPGFLFLVLEK